jgi:hypothetical protein
LSPAKALVVVGCAVVLLGCGIPAAHAGHASAASPDGPVVLIGVPDLEWQDVTTTGTPALWQLAGRSSIGAMTDQSGEGDAHRAAGWMTLNTGSRAVAFVNPPLAVPNPADPAQLDRLKELNRSARFHAQVGALGDALHRAGRTVAAVGGGGAVVGAMTSQGTVDIQSSSVSDALRRGVDVVIVELPQLYAVDRTDTAAVRDALTTIDDTVGTIETQIPSGASLLVAGVSDAANRQAHLHVAMANGPRFGPGRLTSPSTGRDGVVQLIDVASTVLWLSQAPIPTAAIGEHWQSVSEARIPTATEIPALVDLDRRSIAQIDTQTAYFRWIALVAFLYVAATGVLWARRRTGPPLLVSAAVAAVPVASWLLQLVPWWRIGDWSIAPITAGFALGIGVLAVLSPWPRDRRWRLAGVIGALSAAVIAVDVATGSNLSLDAPFGDNPIIAGRFTGTGNDAFAVLATGTLALAAATVTRMRGRRAAAVVFGLGGAAVVVIGDPDLGDKFGGVLALLPTVVLLGLVVSGVRLSRRYVVATLGAIAVTVATVAAFALVDHARPPSQQTHLGRFVGQVFDGQAGTIIWRKLDTSLATFTNGWSRWIVLIWLALAVAFCIARRRGWARSAGHPPPRTVGGLAAALGVLGVLGPALNDSGLSITAFIFYLGAPLLVPLIEPVPVPAPSSAAPGQDARKPVSARSEGAAHQRM